MLKIFVVWREPASVFFKQSDLFIIKKANLNEQTEQIYNAVFHNVTWHFNFTPFHVRLPILIL